MQNVEGRAKANNKILKIIKIYLMLHPGMRFNQALYNLGIVKNGVDDFYKESTKLLRELGGKKW